MTTVTVPLWLRLPSRRVFDMFTDIEHVTERVSNIQKIEMLTVGGVRLGSRSLETQVLGHQDSPRDRSHSVPAKPHVHHQPLESGARIKCTCSRSGLSTSGQFRIEFFLQSHGLPPGALAPVGRDSGKVAT